jgi:arylsulfatase A-like enzyme
VTFGEFILSSSLAELIANSHRVRRLLGYYDILGRKTAETINGDFLKWVSHNSSRPFFAFLNYYDAHEPYLPPVPFDTKFSTKTRARRSLIRYWSHEAGRLPGERLSPEQIRAEIDAYDDAIAYLDHQLGNLFAELDKRHLLEKTLIIVTSDHGEAFGENGIFSHGNSLYRSVIQVPLLISFPSHLPAGKRIQDVVSLRDLPSTILDFLEVRARMFPGHSLVRYWDPQRAKDSHKTVAVSVLRSDGSSRASEWKGAKQSIVSAGQHYIINGDGREELYDWVNDPREMLNLAISKTNVNQLPCFREYISKVFDRKSIHQAGLE